MHKLQAFAAALAQALGAMSGVAAAKPAHHRRHPDPIAHMARSHGHPARRGPR